MTQILFSQYSKKYKFYGYVGAGGTGGFGRVVIIQNKQSKQCYALKKIQLKSCQEIEDVKNQVRMLEKLSHLPVIKIVEYYIVYIDTAYTQHCCQVGIIMQLAQTSLAFIIRKDNKLRCQIDLLQFIIRFASLLHQCQKLNIAHRDIKPDNILLCKNQKGQMQYKLADFGLAIEVKNRQQYTQFAGSYPYASPKLKQKLKNKNKQIKIKSNLFKDDVYSLGITIIQILTCKNKITKEVISKIQQLNLDERILAILDIMLRQQQDQRPNFGQLMAFIQDKFPEIFEKRQEQVEIKESEQQQGEEITQKIEDIKISQFEQSETFVGQYEQADEFTNNNLYDPQTPQQLPQNTQTEQNQQTMVIYQNQSPQLQSQKKQSQEETNSIGFGIDIQVPRVGSEDVYVYRDAGVRKLGSKRKVGRVWSLA